MENNSYYILKKYIYLSGFTTLFCYILLGIIQFDYYQENFSLFFINFINAITYIGLLLYIYYKKISVFELLTICFFYNMFYGSIYVYLIYDYSGQLFQFFPSDGPLYDDFGKDVAGKNIFEGVKYLVDTTKYDMADMGMVYYVSFLYKFISSPFIVKFANLFLNLGSTYIIYSITVKMIDKEYAKYAALIFSISSYNIWFLISGLKEPLMIFLILGCYKQYFNYIEEHKIYYLFSTFFIASSMLLFRVPLFLMLLLSITSSELIRLKISPYKMFVLIVSIVCVGYYMYIYMDLIYWYMSISNWGFIGEEHWKEENSNLFLVLLSVLYGPFPTITPIEIQEYHDVSVYANGLIFKMYLSYYSIIAILIILKRKSYFLISIVLFCILEMGALVIIEQTFKLRFAFPHLPFIIILGFYGMFYIAHYQNKYTLVKKINIISNACIPILILMWNLYRY